MLDGNQNQNVGKNPKSEYGKKVKVMRKRQLVRQIAFVLIGCLGAASRLRAQGQVVEVTLSRPNGLRIYGITGSLGYSSLPPTLAASKNYEGLGSNTAIWSSIIGGYAHSSERTKFNLIYTPSFSGRFRSSGVQSFNQNLAIDGSYLITPKVTLSLGATGDDSTLEQLLIQPGSLSLLVGGQPNFDQLTAAAGAGLREGGSPVLRAVYYGTRTLSLSGQAGLSYRPSTRLSVDFRGHVTQAQPSPNGKQNSQALIGRTLMDQSDVIVSYLLTPDTKVGVQTGVMGVRSTISRYQVITTTGIFSRNFARRWFASVDGGTGVIRNLGQQPLGGGVSTVVSGTNGSVGSGTIGYVGSGTIGTNYNRHTLVAYYGRTLGDVYGFGSGATRSLLGAWSWFQRGMTWGMFATVGEQSMSGSSLGNISTRQTSAGASRSLNRQLQVSLTYAYLMNSQLPIFLADNASRHAVLFSITWVPSGSQMQQMQIGARP